MSAKSPISVIATADGQLVNASNPLQVHETSPIDVSALAQQATLTTVVNTLQTTLTTLQSVLTALQSTLQVQVQNPTSTSGLALDATLTAGAQKAVVRGGTKGTTNAAADVTSTAEGSNHQALDVQLYNNGSAIDPTQIRALTTSDAVTATINGTPNVAVTNTPAVTIASGNVTANVSGVAQDATLTAGSQVAIVKSGTKGTSTGTVVTSTAEGANNQALDVQLYHGGVAKDPTQIRPLTSSDVVSATVTNTPSVTVTSGTVTATVAGVAQDSTLTGGNLIGTLKSGTKGTSTGALVTSTTEGTNNQALDVQIYHGGAAKDPTQIRPLTTSDAVSATITNTPSVTVSSGTVTATVSGVAQDSTLTGGNQVSILKSGTKGTSTGTAVTSTAEGANNQALDVQLYHGGTAINPTLIRPLTVADAVTATINGTPNVSVTNTPAVTIQSGTVTATVSGVAQDSTLTGGNLIGVLKSGTKGTSTGALVTSTAEGANNQALDVQLYHSGVAKDPTAIRPLTSTDQISVANFPTSQTVSGTVAVSNNFALDATLTAGSQKTIARSGTKGSSTPADLTSTAEGTDHQALDVQLYHSGAAVSPATETTLSTLSGKVPSQGQSVMATSLPVVIASNQSAVAVSDNNGSLTVDSPGMPTALGQAVMATSMPVVIASNQSAVTVSGTVTATSASTGVVGAAAPTSATEVGASDGTNLQVPRVFDADTSAGTQYVLGAVLRQSASGGSVEAGTGTAPLRIDPTGTTTQPVSFPSAPTVNLGTIGTVATESTLSSLSSKLPALGQGVKSSSVSVALASDQGTAAAPIRVDPTGTTAQPVNQGTAAAITSAWPVKVTDGAANTMPTGDAAGRAIFTKVTDGTNTMPTGDSVARALKVDGSGVTQPTSLAGILKGSSTAAGVTASAQTTNINALDTSVVVGGQVVDPRAQGTAAALSSAWPVKLTDGTNTMPTGDAAARPLFTNTAQGTAAALSGAWPIKLTDGTNAMPTADAAGRALFAKITDGTNLMPTGDAVARPVFTSAAQGTAAAITSAWPVKVTDGAANTMPTGDAAGRAIFTKVTDGTNTMPTGDTAARALKVDGSAVSQPVTLSAGIGQKAAASSLSVVLSSDTNSVKVSDGTSTVAVKAASTSAVAADQALVVALSPNNAVGLGAAAKGTSTAGSLTASVQTANTTALDTSILVSGAAIDPRQVTLANVTATAALKVDASATTVGQGTPAASAANAWSIKVSDGTANTAAVKAASTAAVATDPALVVAVNPFTGITQGAAAALTSAWPVKITDGASNVMPAGDVAARAIRVDPAGTTPQPVTLATGIGQKAGASSLSVVLASDQSSVRLWDGTNTAAVKTGAAVNGDPALVVAVSPSTPITTSGVADTTASGTLGASGNTVIVSTAGANTVGMAIPASTTLVATLIPEVSVDGGTTWVSTYFDDPVTSTKVSSLAVSSGVAVSRTIVGVGGSGQSRVRVGSYSSGTTTATLRATTRMDPSVLYTGAAAGALPPTVAQVGGSDGSNLRALLTDTTGKLLVSSSPSDTTASATLGTLNATVSLTLAGQQNVGFYIPVTSTLSGTLSVFVSVDGTTFTAAGCYFEDATTGVRATTFITASGFSYLKRLIVPAGTALVLVMLSAYNSGTTTGYLRGTAMPTGSLGWAIVGNAAPTWATLAGASDGTTLRPLRSDSSGQLVVSNHPTSVGQKTASASLSVTLASDNTGPIVIGSHASASFVRTAATNQTSTSVLSANTAARSRILYNDGTLAAYIKFGSAATTTSFTLILQPGATYFFDAPMYNGVVHAYWNSASAVGTGSIQATEVS